MESYLNKSKVKVQNGTKNGEANLKFVEISNICVQSKRHKGLDTVPDHQSFTLEMATQSAIPKVKPDISIPGISKIFDPDYNIYCKVLWILALIFCASACFYQSFIQLKAYFSYAVTVDLTILRNQTVEFPAITFCPATLSHLFEKELKELIQNKCNDSCPPLDSEELKNYSFNKIGLSLDELWDIFRIPLETVQTSTPCGSIVDIDDDNNCTEDYVDLSMNSSFVKTFWGTCLILSPENFLEYQGPDTYIKFKINDSMLRSADIFIRNPETDDERMRHFSLLFFLHGPNVVNRHDAIFLAEMFMKRYFTVVRFTAKEFNFLNTSEKPCTNEQEVTECRNQCIDKKLSKKLNCSLPFMKSHKPLCSTLWESRKAYGLANSIYNSLKSSDCHCKRKCKEVAYSLTTDVMYPLTRNETIFHLYYPDNLHEVINESYAYPSSSLLSDLAANLGFYLGFCVLTLLQMIEAILQRR